MKKYASQSFTELEESRNKYNETKDCTVKALAIASGFSYEKCHNFLRLEGRMPKQGFHNEPSYAKVFNVGPNIHKRYWGKTIKSLGRHYLNPNKVYIIYTSSHVLCYRDGAPQDWTDGRQCRIKSIHEVTLKDEGKRLLGSMSNHVKVLKKRKKRVAKVRYELRALFHDEHGDIYDVQHFHTFKKLPTKVISRIKFDPQNIWIVGRKEETQGKLAVYDLENEMYLVDSIPEHLTN